MAAKKQKQPEIVFGDLPREGYVYSLYRGHVIRLGLVVAALIAILIWAWSGSWTSVKSYLFPGGTADLSALAETTIPHVEEDPQKTVFQADRIDDTGIWVQDHCYRLEISFDTVEALDLILDDTQMYLVAAGEYCFLAADFLSEEAPAVGTTYQAVFTPVSEQLAHFLPEDSRCTNLPGYLIDLRDLPVGYENSDTVQMLVFTPVVIALLVFWLLMLQDPKRHPIYRQLGRYGLSVAAVVASIDREVAMGEIVSDERRSMVTTTWNMQKSPFMTVIYKNTAPIDTTDKTEKER